MKGISALVLAAGLSSRMGQPKLLLPWGGRTIIEAVVQTLLDGGLEDILVVTGGSQAAVRQALAGFPVRLVPNPAYHNGEMLDSIKAGLAAAPASAQAALITLGDQPQMQVGTVRSILEAWSRQPGKITIPSYAVRRGHPWVLPARLWEEVLGLSHEQTLRDVLNAHQDEIAYVSVPTASILADIDTPEDYRQAGGGSHSPGK